MSKRSQASRGLSPIGESDDEDFDNAPNVLSDECMTKIVEGIGWVDGFCDKTMAENKDRKPSSEEGLKENVSESDIHLAFRTNPTAGDALLRFNQRAGKIAVL